MQFPVIDAATFTSLTNIEVFGQGVLESLKQAIAYFLMRDNLTDWRFYVFIYVAFSIASGMKLSWPDIRTALLGFVSIIAGLFLLNLLTLWSGQHIHDLALTLAGASRSIYAVMLFVLMMNIIVAITIFLFYVAVSTLRTVVMKR